MSSPPPTESVIGRQNTPPPHTTLSHRSIVPTAFDRLRPTDVRTNSTFVTWSCDGRRLLSCGLERGVRGWLLDTFEERSTYNLTATGLTDPVICTQGHPIHPDLLCATSECHKLVFWDFRVRGATRVVDTGTTMRSIQWHEDGTTVLAKEVSSDSDVPDSIALYDVKAGTNLASVSAQDIGLRGNTIHQILFNHRSQIVYVTGSRGELAMLDYPSLSCLYTIKSANVGGCISVGVDRRGRYVATGGEDSIVNLWTVQDWICSKTLADAESPIVAISFSHDSEYIANACESGYFDIYEAETGLHNARINQRSNARSVAWHPAKTILASAGGERRSEAWISLLQ